MATVSIRREHRLGLERARALARQWAEHAEHAYGLRCTLEEDAGGERVHFQRSGVEGVLRAGADRLQIQARLGLLLGALRHGIEQQIEAELDRLLAEEEGR
jgi:putative polyhydroxyalkanoate system protein